MAAVHDLLWTLLRLGEQQRAALLRDDLAAFDYLLNRRADLLAALDGPVPATADDRAELAGLAAMLSAQSRELAALLAERSEATVQELAALRQGYAAARQYIRPPSAPRATHEFRA